MQADHETNGNALRRQMGIVREPADEHLGDESLDRRAGDDLEDLRRGLGRRNERGHSVERSEYAAEDIPYTGLFIQVSE